jgi:thiol:disulfide interchange protein DsbD
MRQPTPAVCGRLRLPIIALLALAAMLSLAPPRAQAEEAGVLDRLRALGGAEVEPQFLPVEKAFAVRATVLDRDTLAAEFEPQPGYYLYRERFVFAIADGAARVAQVELPRGVRKEDPNFGDTEVFYQPVRAVVRLEGAQPPARQVTLEATFQGCAEAGLCYPPETRRFHLALADAPSALAPGDAVPGGVSTTPADAGTGAADETTRIAAILASGNFWAIVASFLGFGVLLAFTPCVLPMVPILSGIIAGQGHAASRRQVFLLTLVYVLGMALAYALAGIAAGLSGTLLTSALQNPWVLGGIGAVFVLLALAMFGVYELQLPSSVQSRLSSASNRLPGGTFGGVFAMGVLSALIVGPCVAAPLAGALLYINQSRDAVLGGSALFAMALGMGVPLLAVGASAGSLLPRAGPWMQTVKNFFGVVLLGVAIWIVSPVIPTVITMLLWAALLIISAVYLHAIDPLPHNAGGLRKLWKGIGVIALLTGVALLIGALAGGRDVLQPLAGLRVVGDPGRAPEAAAPRFALVRSVEELDRALQAAAGRPVMLDFYADWCVSCKEMERFTFTDPQVQARMARMVLLKADVTANSAQDLALLKRFGLFGPPGTVFFDPAGRELPQRVVGFQSAGTFARVLDRVLGAAT